MSSLTPESIMPVDPKICNSQLGEEHLKLWNCINCRRRKVRCDRRHPCAPCTKYNTECVFPVSGRIPRRSRDAHLKKQTELVGRLRRLEAMVGGLSSQVEQSTGVGPDNLDNLFSGSSSGTDAGNVVPSGRDFSDISNTRTEVNEDGILAPDHSRIESSIANDSELSRVSGDVAELDITSNGDIVVGSRFWTVFCEEVEDIFEAVHGSTVISFDENTNSSTGSAPNNGSHTGYHNFLLRSVSAAHQRRDPHLPPSQILSLWQFYVDNVDPFIKILHIPTVTRIIHEAKGSYSSFNTGMRALVLATSFAASMSLAEGEVKTNFGIEKSQLVAHYRAGAELALEQTNFLHNIDMTILQAITIYLTVLQGTDETRTVWFVNGTLIRLAVCMNIHREGSQSTFISPLESEMRRRLWWQICLIDSRSQTCSDSRYKLSQQMFNCEMPTNQDDRDLELLLSIPPLVQNGWTDSTVFVLRCEVWRLSQKLQSMNQTQPISQIARTESLKLFQDWRARIEKTYLKHLDSTNSLYTFTWTSVSLFFAKIDFILHSTLPPSQPSKTTPALASEELFNASLSIITHTHALQQSPEWVPYRWQLSNQQNLPWHALHFVLTHLCVAHPWTSTCEDALSAAERSLKHRTEQISQQDNQYQDLLSLLSTVEKRREREVQRQAASIGAEDAAVNLGTASLKDRSHGDEPDSFNTAIRESSREDPTLGVDLQIWGKPGLGSASFDLWDLSGF